ncbi:MAG: radical SAM protein [Candidatus Riflebacteria bacterium]|nr:radical SAM protein [Candidatus Riflebacteria bacterium]
MRLISIQEAYARKFERQKRVATLELHASGHCAHIGLISPGCRACFEPDPFRRNILCGARCNAQCRYCSENIVEEPDKEWSIRSKARIYKDSYVDNYSPGAVSFSGGGEPLLYLGVIEEYMAIFRDVAPRMKSKPWYYLYTNGILASSEVLLKLKELGFDEIRFHLGASDFSRKVLRNMEEAVRHFKAITVETPAWPLHRKKIFETLPILNDIGIKHLNLGEIEIKKHNLEKISALLPEAEMYHCHEMHLDDGGLTYDVMEEVAARKFSYSVLDCNCFVKSMQRGPAKGIRHGDIQGLFASYP